MDKPIYLTQDMKIVLAQPPTDSAWDIAGDYVSLKNAHMAWIMVNLQFDPGQTFAHTIQPMKATAVLPVGATAITHVAPNWANNDISVSDTLVRGADATSYQVPATVTNKIVLFQIDPMQLGVTYDCMGVTVDGNAKWQGNLLSITYLVEMRYGQATPPSIIVD